MKLSTIRDNVDKRPAQVRIICGGPTLLAEAVKKTNSPPLSYLFIESIAATKVLDEAGEGRLGALLKTGLAKLNAALTPGTASDLDSLLTFQAPNGGGSKAIGSLVQQAKQSKGDVTQDQNWWNSLFNVFNVSDDTIKSNIINQVQQDTNTGAAPPTGGATQETQGDPLDDTAPAAAPAAPAPAAEPAAAPAAQGGTADLLAKLKAARDTEQANQKNLTGKLDTVRQQRQANQAEMGHLSNKIEQARGQGQPAESIWRDIAIDMLQEHAVQQHLNVVTGHMLRNLAMRVDGRAISLPAINERGLGERLRSALGDFLTNPRRTKEKLAGATGTANNERAAKLAVQALTDHARTEFESKLTENSLTPDQITKDLNTWASLKSLYDKSPTPQVVDAYIEASGKLKKVAELFGSTAQFDVEEPVDAEAVEEPPVNAELVGEPAEEPVDAELVDDNEGISWGDVTDRSPFKPQAEPAAEPAPTWDDVDDASPFKQEQTAAPPTWDDVDEASPFKPETAAAPTWDDVDEASPFKPQAEPAAEPEPEVDPRSPFAAGGQAPEENKDAADFRKAIADFDAQQNKGAARESRDLEGLPINESWGRLMSDSFIREGAEKLLTPYTGYTVDNIPIKARTAILKRLYG